MKPHYSGSEWPGLLIFIFNVIVGERTETLLEIGGVTVMYRGKDLGKMRHNRRQQKDGGDHETMGEHLHCAQALEPGELCPPWDRGHPGWACSGLTTTEVNVVAQTCLKNKTNQQHQMPETIFRCRQARWRLESCESPLHRLPGAWWKGKATSELRKGAVPRKQMEG